MNNNKQLVRIMILNGVIFGILSLTILGLLAGILFVLLQWPV